MGYIQNYFGLSEPKEFSNKSLLNDIKQEYQILYRNFIDKEVRPKLRGVPIFVKDEKIQEMEERFLHIISIEDKDYYKKILPCTNLNYADNCISKCKQQNALFLFSRLKRVECIYRLSRVQWIPQIIEYANKGDSNVTMWRYDNKDKSGKWYWSRYVRYKYKSIDYLIVFNELYDKTDKNKLNYLDFRTAYPVFKGYESNKLDKQSRKYPLI